MPYVPQMSFRRDSLGFSGDAIIFLTFLFSDHAIGLEFLKDTWLIRSKVQCNRCGRDMTWHADPSALDRFRWRCPKMRAGTRCSRSRSVRHGSWFQGSHLILQEVLYLTYILRREPAEQIQREHHFSDHTIADWGMFCREMRWYIGWAALRRSAVLTRPLRSMEASSVGRNTIADTL